MRKNLLKKAIVCGIIVLFVGASVVPSISGTIGDFNNIKIRDLVVPVNRKTIYVDDDFEDDPKNHKWNTITEGIADAEDGDTILVYNGTYNETLEVDKAVDIIGNCTQGTIIDGNYSGTVVNITSNGVKISNFTVKNSGSTGDAIKGIEVWWGTDIDISYNLFSNNYIDLVFSYCDGFIQEVVASNNIFTKGRIYNDGLYVYKSNNVKVHNNTFSDKNWGVYLYDADEVILLDNIFSNVLESIRLWSSRSNHIIDNDISNNLMEDRGIWLYNSDKNEVKHNSISNNEYGLYLEGSDNNEIKNNLIFDNYVGLYLDGGERHFITNNDISDNDKAVVIWRSQLHKIVYNNIEDSESGWDLICWLSLVYAGKNWWGDRKGPRGKVCGLPIILCWPKLDKPWQEVVVKIEL